MSTNSDKFDTSEWYKDKKLLAGFILVFLSIVLGFYGKVVFIAQFYEPIGIITGISIWVFSWVLLFMGIFLVGWETVKIMQQRIHHEVKTKVKQTYHYTKEHAKKGVELGKRLHKKSIKKISKTSRSIANKSKSIARGLTQK